MGEKPPYNSPSPHGDGMCDLLVKSFNMVPLRLLNQLVVPKNRK